MAILSELNRHEEKRCRREIDYGDGRARWRSAKGGEMDRPRACRRQCRSLISIRPPRSLIDLLRTPCPPRPSCPLPLPLPLLLLPLLPRRAQAPSAAPQMTHGQACSWGQALQHCSIAVLQHCRLRSPSWNRVIAGIEISMMSLQKRRCNDASRHCGCSQLPGAVGHGRWEADWGF